MSQNKQDVKPKKINNDKRGHYDIDGASYDGEKVTVGSDKRSNENPKKPSNNR